MSVTATIAITPGSGQLLDAVSVNVAGNTVVRETMVIADPTNAGNLANVNGSGALSITGTVIASQAIGFPVGVAWTSSTAANTANTIALSGYSNACVTVHYSGTVTGGQIFFEGSDDSVNWYPMTMAPADDGTLPVDNYVLSSAAGNIAWQMFTGGFQNFRARLGVQVVGSGTASVTVTPSTGAAEPAPQVTQGTSPWVISGTVVNAAETTKVIGTVRVLGNTGATVDAAPAATAPTNGIQQIIRGATAYPIAVTDGQTVVPMADKAGRQAVVLNSPRDLIGTVQLNSSSGSAVSFIAAGGANVFNDIISLIITNESSTATVVTLSDNGSGGNTYKFAIAANGGIVINFPTPLPQGTSAAAWDVLNSAAVACDYVAVYAKNK